MIDDVLLRLLLFYIVEGLMHPSQLIIALGRLHLLAWEELLLRHVIRLQRIASSRVLVSSCPRSNAVIISCVILMTAI